MEFLYGITRRFLSITRNPIWRTYLFVFILIILLNFFLPRLLPGGPIDYLQGIEDGAIITEAQKEEILTYYQLDAPISQQFLGYLIGVLTFDYGVSFSYSIPVQQLIFSHLSNTLWVVGIATILSMIIGIIMGLISGWWHRKKSERGLLVSMLGLSAMPEFLVGLAVLLLLAVYVPLFPLSGARTPFMENTHLTAVFLDRLYHAFLPILTLTIVNVSSMYLLMRNSTIQILNTPFIQFASVKGLSVSRILCKHVAKNAILPIYTLITIRASATLVGAVFVETVFSYPGIGLLLQEAILSRDYPLMHGLFFLFTLMTLSMNALADVTYPKLDPRLQQVGGQK